ncbi:hypothetical protein QFC20_003652 [Naganishia adeliensis]|uniref:Uncharacterized protein n=1 Tax=Naganishia adeliensis TaxID=92952 RepID=A0ACC2WA44_9TREE|nr:hypothetical protein QFC20_003652 [Naganishia adeliensis]
MYTLSAGTLAAVAIALVSSAAAAPIESHPTVLKRALGALIASGSGCLGVEKLENGAGVGWNRNCTTSTPTSSPPFYNRWDISPGNNEVIRLSGLPAGSGDFCMDSGDLAGSYPPFKIWTCYPGLAAQQWYYTDDKHLAVTGGNRCVETGRYGTNLNFCSSSSNTGSQVWDIVEGGATTTPPPPPPPPSGQGKTIRWTLNGQQKCLTVANGYLANGAALTINDCFDAGSTYFSLQQFVYTSGSTNIRVAPNSLSTTDYCVDFGSDRGVNGVGLKIWQCYDGLPAQQLYITGDNHIAVEGDNQCADVKAESQASQAKPYGSLKDVQSWQCSGGNPNQIFGF